MSTSPYIRRWRLALNMSSHTPLKNLLTNEDPIAWRGTDLQIEVALFDGTTIVDAFGSLTSLTCELHTGDRESSPLIQKTKSSFTTISAQDWTDGDMADCHCAFVFTKEEMQVAITATSQTEKKTQFWLVVHGVLADGTYVTAGCAKPYIEEDGAQNGLAVSSSEYPAYRISDGELQLWDADAEQYRTIFIKNGTIAFGEGEA